MKATLQILTEPKETGLRDRRNFSYPVTRYLQILFLTAIMQQLSSLHDSHSNTLSRRFQFPAIVDGYATSLCPAPAVIYIVRVCMRLDA